MKRLIAALGLLALSCGDPPPKLRSVDATVPDSNVSPTTVTVAAEFEGIRLYRVLVDGRFVYVARFTIGDKPEVQTQWEEGCGKNCMRGFVVQTVER